MQETEPPVRARQVGKRQVFYIPGFDPHPARRYRELYRSEGAKQAAISGYELELSAHKGEGFGWGVSARIEDASVNVAFEVLEWSDIVRGSIDQTLGGTYLQLFRTAWLYFSTGAIWRLMQVGRGPILAAFYPVVGLLVQLALSLLVGRLLGGAVVSLTGAPFWVAWAVGLPVAWGILERLRLKDGRVFVHYLMHDFAYTAQDRGAYPTDLAARVNAFADRVGAALASDVDEVLVVGHSSGAALGVSVLAELERRGVVGQGPPLALLTLGQSVPMISFLPEAQGLRRDLNTMAADTGVAWLDVSAPGDGCSFALADPVAVSGVAPDPQRWPIVISAAFTKTLSPETIKSLRWRFFRKHFQYLCVDTPGDYDYFRITAGPQTLAARISSRGSSASRIARPASGFRTMSP